MAGEISTNLLLNAKGHLASGDFEKAANSAKGVLALDAGNVEATEILTAAEAAGAGSPQKDNERDTELQTARLNVQMALSGRNFFKAEEAIQELHEMEHQIQKGQRQLLICLQSSILQNQIWPILEGLSLCQEERHVS